MSFNSTTPKRQNRLNLFSFIDLNSVNPTILKIVAEISCALA